MSYSVTYTDRELEKKEVRIECLRHTNIRSIRSIQVWSMDKTSMVSAAIFEDTK